MHTNSIESITSYTVQHPQYESLFYRKYIFFHPQTISSLVEGATGSHPSFHWMGPILFPPQSLATTEDNHVDTGWWMSSPVSKSTISLTPRLRFCPANKAHCKCQLFEILAASPTERDYPHGPLSHPLWRPRNPFFGVIRCEDFALKSGWVVFTILGLITY